MKKNWAARLGILVAVLTLITASMVSGTFAKYTTEVSASDTARVAKFDFNVQGNGADIIGNEIDIFSMIDEDSVLTGSGIRAIAPGTKGDFSLHLANDSEVDVQVAFTLNETNAEDIPVYYTIGTDKQRYSSVLTGSYTVDTDTFEYLTITDLQEALKAYIGTGGVMDANDGSTIDTKDFTVNWVWAFETAGTGQTDILDTELGNDATPAEITLGITCTATQVD